MVQICINNNACIDIYETDGFYAHISFFNTKHRIGPEYDLAALNRYVMDFIHDLTYVAKINDSQKMDLKALQAGLMNCQLEESDYEGLF